MSYSLDDKARARSLFIESGSTLEEVAAETGISVQSLRNWSKDGEWMRERGEFETSYLQLSTRLHKLKVELVDEALAKKNPQQIYALANLMRATAPRLNRTNGEDKATLFLDFAGKFIEYLRGRDGEALRHLEPHLRGFAAAMKQAEAA